MRGAASCFFHCSSRSHVACLTSSFSYCGERGPASCPRCHGCRMDLIAQEHSVVSWTAMTLAVVVAAVVGKTGVGVLRAYYILRVRAGE